MLPLLFAFGASVPSACGFLGEQQFWFFARNDLDQPVILRFDHWPDVLVKPGVNGRAATSFGAVEGPILVLDQQCRVLHSIEVTTQTGSIWLRADGTARLAETTVDRAQVQLPVTDMCAS